MIDCTISRISGVPARNGKGRLITIATVDGVHTFYMADPEVTRQVALMLGEEYLRHQDQDGIEEEPDPVIRQSTLQRDGCIVDWGVR